MAEIQQLRVVANNTGDNYGYFNATHIQDIQIDYILIGAVQNRTASYTLTHETQGVVASRSHSENSTISGTDWALNAPAGNYTLTVYAEHGQNTGSEATVTYEFKAPPEAYIDNLTVFTPALVSLTEHYAKHYKETLNIFKGAGVIINEVFTEREKAFAEELLVSSPVILETDTKLLNKETLLVNNPNQIGITEVLTGFTGFEIMRKIGSGTWESIAFIPYETREYKNSYSFVIGESYFYKTYKIENGERTLISNEVVIVYEAGAGEHFIENIIINLPKLIAAKDEQKIKEILEVETNIEITAPTLINLSETLIVLNPAEVIKITQANLSENILIRGPTELNISDKLAAGYILLVKDNIITDITDNLAGGENLNILPVFLISQADNYLITEELIILSPVEILKITGKALVENLLIKGTSELNIKDHLNYKEILTAESNILTGLSDNLVATELLNIKRPEYVKTADQVRANSVLEINLIVQVLKGVKLKIRADLSVLSPNGILAPANSAMIDKPMVSGPVEVFFEKEQSSSYVELLDVRLINDLSGEFKAGLKEDVGVLFPKTLFIDDKAKLKDVLNILRADRVNIKDVAAKLETVLVGSPQRLILADQLRTLYGESLIVSGGAAVDIKTNLAAGLTLTITTPLMLELTTTLASKDNLKIFSPAVTLIAGLARKDEKLIISDIKRLDLIDQLKSVYGEILVVGGKVKTNIKSNFATGETLIITPGAEVDITTTLASTVNINVNASINVNVLDQFRTIIHELLSVGNPGGIFMSDTLKAFDNLIIPGANYIGVLDTGTMIDNLLLDNILRAEIGQNLSSVEILETDSIFETGLEFLRRSYEYPVIETKILTGVEIKTGLKDNLNILDSTAGYIFSCKSMAENISLWLPVSVDFLAQFKTPYLVLRAELTIDERRVGVALIERKTELSLKERRANIEVVDQ